MTLLNMVRIFVKSNPPYSLELQRDPKSVGLSTTKPSGVRIGTGGWEVLGQKIFLSFLLPFYFEAAWYSIDMYVIIIL